MGPAPRVLIPTKGKECETFALNFLLFLTEISKCYILRYMDVKNCRCCRLPKPKIEFAKSSRECLECAAANSAAGTGTCFDCGSTRPLAEFVTGTRRCKVCRSERDRTRWSVMPPEKKARKLATKRDWGRMNREVRRAENRSYRERNPDVVYNYSRKKYGFNVALRDEALRIQKGGCAICGANLASLQDVGTRRVCCDHDHATNEPRGILCGHCNTGLGMFKDSPANLAAAIEYLKSPPLSLV